MSVPGSSGELSGLSPVTGGLGTDSNSAAAHEAPGSGTHERYYPPRTCRICLESVDPTFHPPSDNLPKFLQPRPRVVYESSDRELGRLLRPCKCKGSSRYVHEGCLRLWRQESHGSRNYWQCATCRFQYRLERLRWARWISSSWLQLGLTISILWFSVFLLGFIADPLINLYVDPLETIYYTEFWEQNNWVGAVPADKRGTWLEHFVKGLATLGVLSFLKATLAASVWNLWNLRGSGFARRGGATGRSRVASFSWIVVLIGVGHFLVTVYKAVRVWSRSTLVKAGERVMDVPLADDDDDEYVVPAEYKERSKNN